mmetsp:Transcript_35288/g.99071  ORF Transcript_35288/g.99071 Transcript_35288/m.99071 type:complete len:357 (-) Transcript_35288:8-1078(-)
MRGQHVQRAVREAEQRHPLQPGTFRKEACSVQVVVRQAGDASVQVVAGADEVRLTIHVHPQRHVQGRDAVRSDRVHEREGPLGLLRRRDAHAAGLVLLVVQVEPHDKLLRLRVEQDLRPLHHEGPLLAPQPDHGLPHHLRVRVRASCLDVLPGGDLYRALAPPGAGEAVGAIAVDAMGLEVLRLLGLSVPVPAATDGVLQQACAVSLDGIAPVVSPLLARPLREARPDESFTWQPFVRGLSLVRDDRAEDLASSLLAAAVGALPAAVVPRVGPGPVDLWTSIGVLRHIALRLGPLRQAQDPGLLHEPPHGDRQDQPQQQCRVGHDAFSTGGEAMPKSPVHGVCYVTRERVMASNRP